VPSCTFNNSDSFLPVFLAEQHAMGVQSGKKQIYGTQLRMDTLLKHYVPFPITHPQQVNSRRMKLGMIPLEGYE